MAMSAMTAFFLAASNASTVPPIVSCKAPVLRSIEPSWPVPQLVECKRNRRSGGGGRADGMRARRRHDILQATLRACTMSLAALGAGVGHGGSPAYAFDDEDDAVDLDDDEEEDEDDDEEDEEEDEELDE